MSSSLHLSQPDYTSHFSSFPLNITKDDDNISAKRIPGQHSSIKVIEVTEVHFCNVQQLIQPGSICDGFFFYFTQPNGCKKKKKTNPKTKNPL